MGLLDSTRNLLHIVSQSVSRNPIWLIPCWTSFIFVALFSTWCAILSTLLLSAPHMTICNTYLHYARHDPNQCFTCKFKMNHHTYNIKFWQKILSYNSSKYSVCLRVYIHIKIYVGHIEGSQSLCTWAHKLL
jgi:hypothetical protein